MKNYSFYMTQDNETTFLVVENRDTETWEAALLDWDVSEEEAKKTAKDFLDGKESPCTDENGVTWEKDKEHLLPGCAKYFGFTEIYAEA